MIVVFASFKIVSVIFLCYLFVAWTGFGIMGAMTFKDIGGNALIMLTSTKVKCILSFFCSKLNARFSQWLFCVYVNVYFRWHFSLEYVLHFLV
jgi:hypothetical protein